MPEKQGELGTYIPMNMNKVEDALLPVPTGTYVFEVKDAKCKLANKSPKNAMAVFRSAPIYKVGAAADEDLKGGLFDQFVLTLRESESQPLEQAKSNEVGLSFMKRFAKACGVTSFEDAGFEITSLVGLKFGARVVVVSGDRGDLNNVEAYMLAADVEGYAG